MARGGYNKRRIQQKRAKEKKARRRARRNRLILSWLIGVVLSGLIAVVVIALVTGDDKKSLANPSASPSPGVCTSPGPDTLGKKKFASAPCTIIDPKKGYTATMKTSLGDLQVKLFPSEAPITVNNFVFLAQQKFYDGSIFHRVLPDFGLPGTSMVQGGDAAEGNGDLGYSFGDENPAPFAKPGLLAMANRGPATNGSQFFILDGPVDHLNAPGKCPGAPEGCHTVFGEVISGLEVVKKITSAPREGEKPKTDIVLKEVIITEV